MEHRGLHNQRILYGMDKFAIFVLVHSSGKFSYLRVILKRGLLKLFGSMFVLPNSLTVMLENCVAVGYIKHNIISIYPPPRYTHLTYIIIEFSNYYYLRAAVPWLHYNIELIILYLS